MAEELVATRAAGLARMAAFAPRMGRRYAAGRNHDRGPGRHSAVSMLSPWLRRRLLTEPEVIAAAVAAHGPEGAEKFVQEVVWRSYFKGWMERRPQVWASYTAGRDADLARLEDDRRLRKAVAAAEAGETGRPYFDAWVQELVETGYLHNHARMWFASIWIFTLGLPWRIGADFFLRHLLDGDAASNTLGWRWVAGLHTRGKAYAARADNIATYTDGRFAPRPADLAEVTGGLEGEEPEGLPPLHPLPRPDPPRPGLPTVLLLTDEDCGPGLDLAALDLRGAGLMVTGPVRSPRPVAATVEDFDRGAVTDAADRAGLRGDWLEPADGAGLARWAASCGAVQIATPYLPQGPLRDALTATLPHLDRRGIALRSWQRDWDAQVWPHCSAGFFKVRERIPQFLATLEGA